MHVGEAISGARPPHAQPVASRALGSILYWLRVASRRKHLFFADPSQCHDPVSVVVLPCVGLTSWAVRVAAAVPPSIEAELHCHALHTSRLRSWTEGVLTTARMREL